MCKNNIIYILFILFAMNFIACNDNKKEYYDINKSSQQTNNEDSITINTIINSSNKNANKEIPLEIKIYENDYNEYTKNLESKKKYQIANMLDKRFIQLRYKYRNDLNILNILSKFSCIMPDCSSIIKDDVYFYPKKTILQAYNTIIMDKNTNIFNNLDIIKEYDYILSSMQTTSIDLENQYLTNGKQIPYKTIKFVWENPNKLIISLIPKEEICQIYQYSYITTFLQDENGVTTKKYEEKLPMFLYPQDLVLFVNHSCACARALNYIPRLSLNDYKSKNILIPNEKYCDMLESERKNLWEKYMQDSRIIGILQQEQRIYNKDL